MLKTVSALVVAVSLAAATAPNAASVLVEVNQGAIPELFPAEYVVGLQTAGTDAYLFTSRAIYTSSTYSGSALSFVDTLITMADLNVVVNPQTKVAHDLSDSPSLRRFYITGGGGVLGNFLYTLTLSPAPATASVAIDGLGARPNGIAVSPTGVVYLLCKTCSPARVATIDTTTGVTSAGFGMSGDGTLNDPRAIAIGPTGIVYVLDAGNARIASFDASGIFLGDFPVANPSELPADSAMAVGADGKLFVNSPHVRAYDVTTGAFLSGLDRTVDQGFNLGGKPAIAVDDNGFLYDVTGTGLFVHVSTDLMVPRLKDLKVAPKNQTIGSSATGTVKLAAPAGAGGANVALASSNPAVTVPPTVNVPEGATSATFAIALLSAPAANPVEISATFAGITKFAPVNVLELVLKSIQVAPASVKGGASATGTVTLNGAAPAGGVSVALTSSDPAATVPAEVCVLEGATTATFAITTTTVTANKNVSIDASYGGVSKAKILAVTKPAKK